MQIITAEEVALYTKNTTARVRAVVFFVSLHCYLVVIGVKVFNFATN